MGNVSVPLFCSAATGEALTGCKLLGTRTKDWRYGLVFDNSMAEGVFG